MDSQMELGDDIITVPWRLPRQHLLIKGAISRMERAIFSAAPRNAIGVAIEEGETVRREIPLLIKALSDLMLEQQN